MLKAYGVYFSEPLDLDLTMLKAFPEAYAATILAGDGPRSTLEKAAEAALGTVGPASRNMSDLTTTERICCQPTATIS
ncbi:hypothetical protein ACFQX9_36660 [Bradyrhizobium sp. GCM10028915]|uniref:hypothetical protein n=1 Tax=unclassified Bradyrhizobium TaxID=2631580 RepID=UPI003618419B